MNDKTKSLKAIREGRSIGLRKMAEQLGIAPSTLSRIENGKRRPSPDVARLISQHYGLTLEQVLYPAE